MLKFADDTKVFRKIESDADRQQLQDDLNKLTEWSEKWQMLFNYGKCKCLHTGHGNTTSERTRTAKKRSLRMRAHARYAFRRILD